MAACPSGSEGEGSPPLSNLRSGTTLELVPRKEVGQPLLEQGVYSLEVILEGKRTT